MPSTSSTVRSLHRAVRARPDVDTLARAARAVLAEAGSGTLHVEGLRPGTGRPTSVLLHDDGGSPRFVCEPGSPVAAAAARCCPAALRVIAPHRGGEVTGVLLTGHLWAVTTEAIDGVAVPVVGLQVEAVSVEDDEPGWPTIGRRAVPLDRYALAEPPFEPPFEPPPGAP